MRPLTPQLIDFVDAHCIGVLATVDKVAMARQSVVYYLREEQRLLISTESKRVKARDVRRSGVGLALRPRARAAVSLRGLLGPGRDTHREHRPRDAAIVHRIADPPEPPEAQSDEALAVIDRVILAITVEAVTAVNYLPASIEGAAS